MVERVVNMRKLAPPKPDDHQSSSKDSSKKSSISQRSSSFGTSFSKKSLDMAIRHMVNTCNQLLSDSLCLRPTFSVFHAAFLDFLHIFYRKYDEAVVAMQIEQ